jgi:hypothetical protein
MVFLAAVGCLPIIIWNAQHDWVTLRHVTRLAGLQQAPRWYWTGPLVFVGAQCGLLLGFWFIAWVTAMVAYRPGRGHPASLAYLWWLSAPMFAVFFFFSLKTKGGEPNWPVTTYISGLVLTVAWLSRQLLSHQRWYRSLIQVSLATACLLGLLVNLVMHESSCLHPVITAWAGLPTEKNPFPLRRYDPTCRLRGWRTLAQAVDDLRADLRREGTEPVLVATRWDLPGELAFYCKGHPKVYSIGIADGDRRSQYDVWHPNPVADPLAFAGQTFLLVGSCSPGVLRQAFKEVGPCRVVRHFEGDQPTSQWQLTVAHGFRGLPTLPSTIH